jgi:hypothetical protein
LTIIKQAFIERLKKINYSCAYKVIIPSLEPITLTNITCTFKLSIFKKYTVALTNLNCHSGFQTFSVGDPQNFLLNDDPQEILRHSRLTTLVKNYKFVILDEIKAKFLSI